MGGQHESREAKRRQRELLFIIFYIHFTSLLVFHISSMLWLQIQLEEA